MPELPEVEIVKRGLEKAIAGKIILKADVRRPDIRQPIPKNFSSLLNGARAQSLDRRGKYILVFLENQKDENYAGFGLHLGMSGRIKVIGAGETYNLGAHDHIDLRIEGGGRIIFNDPRRFGMAFLIPRNWEAAAPFAAMGPEPLGNHFNGEILARAFAKRKGPVKTALLDQNVVAGVGNIYACEALYMAGIHPEKPCFQLTAGETESLARAIKAVLQKAIKAGGSTLRDYRQTGGELGYFQHQFSAYDREGKSCGACACAPLKTGGVKRIVQAGRSTFYCPEKQKLNPVKKKLKSKTGAKRPTGK